MALLNPFIPLSYEDLSVEYGRLTNIINALPVKEKINV